jgi:hypothetical protein
LLSRRRFRPPLLWVWCPSPRRRIQYSVIRLRFSLPVSGLVSEASHERDLPSPTACLAASSIYIKSRCVAQRRRPFFPTVSFPPEVQAATYSWSADVSPCQLKTLHLRHSPLLHSRNWKDLPVSETGDESAWYLVLREPTEICSSTLSGERMLSRTSDALVLLRGWERASHTDYIAVIS